MSQEELLVPHTSSNVFNPDQVHHRMRLETDNMRRVQSRGPNSGLQINEGQANPPGLGKLYLAIPEGLQGNETECC